MLPDSPRELNRRKRSEAPDEDRKSMHNNADPIPTSSQTIEGTTPWMWLWRLLGIKGDDAPSIRATLALLVVACILPISLVAALLLINYYEREQIQLSNSAINRAQGVALAVDREFAATQSALLALRTSHRLPTGDLEGFHRRAVEAVTDTRADSILVLDKSGQIVLSTRLPYGAALPKLANPLLLKQILETGKPGV